MTLWIIFTALTLAVLALLILPLLRRPAAAPPRVDYDMVVYRDQLAELERDQERGLLTNDQVEAARTEILRRMLAAEDAEPPAGAGSLLAGDRRLRLITAALIIILVPLSAFGIYAKLGAPTMPDQPFAARGADPEFRMVQMAERLAADLTRQPEADGFVTLAETYFQLRRYPESVDAFRQAMAMGVIDSQILASMAEAMVMSNDGMVTPEARQAFQQVLTLDKEDARARFYLGLAKAQIGKNAEAVSIWRDLEKGSPAEAPWLPMLREHIQEYAKAGGFDPAKIDPVPPIPAGPPTAKGPNPHAGVPGAPPVAPEEAAQSGMPSGEAAAAVLAQSPEERLKTIRSMVAGLAARLEQSPEDFDGWMRLARAYKVLGEPDKSVAAARHAVSLKPREVEPKLALAEAQMASVKDGAPLPPEAVGTMREILSVDPENATAMYYLGAAEADAGNGGKAREMLSKVLEMLPAGAPLRAKVMDRLAALSKK
ncbi:MAG TPA: c-type cytochrome biogenesis protein CcmI [Rhodospirillaceae bacterium]|nr:c-type cytochrome biogenesis protein CcmI [Rhodospirillaceae bacterium]